MEGILPLGMVMSVIHKIGLKKSSSLKAFLVWYGDGKLDILIR